MRRSLFFYILFILGIVVVGVGVYVGITSHQVTYQQVKEGKIAHYLANGQDGYLQMEGSDDLYILYEQDFTPPIMGTDTFQNGSVVTFVYAASETTSISETSVLGTHLEGRAARVMSITQLVNGKRTEFKTGDYSQNPQGFYRNNWPYGAGGSVIGLLLIAGAFLMPGMRSKEKQQREGQQSGGQVWTSTSGNAQQQPQQQEAPSFNSSFQPQFEQANPFAQQASPFASPPGQTSLTGSPQMNPFAGSPQASNSFVSQSGVSPFAGHSGFQQAGSPTQQPWSGSQQAMPQANNQPPSTPGQPPMTRLSQFKPRFPSQPGFAAAQPSQPQWPPAEQPQPPESWPPQPQQ